MEVIDPLLAVGITVGTTIVVWLVTLAYQRFAGQPKPNKNVLKVLAFIGATALSYFFNPVDLPPMQGNPVDYALALLATAVTVFKGAQLFYDAIWQRVGDLLDRGLQWGWRTALGALKNLIGLS